MKVCDKCFAETPDDSTYCKQCGAPLTGSFEAKEGADREVYPDLARVNLLRMRGELRHAERDCLAILRRFPNNATANILMGDILVDIGRLDDAANCFETALDVDPTSDLPKSRLARVEALREEAVREASAPPPAPPAVRFWAWAVFVGVALLVGTASYVAGRRLAEPAEAQRPGAIDRPLDLRRPANLIASTDRDAAVLKAISKDKSDIGGQIVTLSFDPQSARLLVIRAVSGEPSRTDVLRLACQTGLAALAADEDATSVQVKLVGTLASRRETLFSGVMARQEASPDPATAAEPALTALFNPAPWWNPRLAPAATPTTPAPGGNASPPPGPKTSG